MEAGSKILNRQDSNNMAFNSGHIWLNFYAVLFRK